jgi:hypothetical protein
MFKLSTKIILTNITLWLFIIPSGNRNPLIKIKGDIVFALNLFMTEIRSYQLSSLHFS